MKIDKKGFKVPYVEYINPENQHFKSIKHFQLNPDSLKQLNSWILSEGNRINLKD